MVGLGDVEIKYSAQITSTFKSGIWNDGTVFNLFEGYLSSSMQAITKTKTSIQNAFKIYRMRENLEGEEFKMLSGE